MRQNRDWAISVILDHEGGYSNDPTDRGGETNMGITAKTLEQAKYIKLVPGDLDIKKLSRPHAAAIYGGMYWGVVKADALPTGVDLLVFDAAVQSGSKIAVKHLQQALNAAFGTRLSVDGVIGPKTLSTALDARDKGGRFDLFDLIDGVGLVRARFYASIVIADPTQRKFLLGWTNRIWSVCAKARGRLMDRVG